MSSAETQTERPTIAQASQTEPQPPPLPPTTIVQTSMRWLAQPAEEPAPQPAEEPPPQIAQTEEPAPHVRVAFKSCPVVVTP